VGALIWSINRTEEIMHRAIWWVAPVFAVVCFVYLIIESYLNADGGGFNLTSALMISIIALFYAFLCLLVVLTGWVLIQLVRGKIQF